jgi:hypothetical protein
LEKYHEKEIVYHEYYESHREEIEKIKNNKDLSEEFKDIVRVYLTAQEDFERESANFWHYLEINYVTKNSKMNVSEVSNANDEHFRKHLRRSGKKDRYTEWLESEVE